MNDISPETAQKCGFPDFFFVYFIVICVIDYISQVGGEYCGEIFEIVYGLCRSCVVVLKVSFSISSLVTDLLLLLSSICYWKPGHMPRPEPTR